MSPLTKNIMASLRTLNSCMDRRPKESLWTLSIITLHSNHASTEFMNEIPNKNLLFTHTTALNLYGLTTNYVTWRRISDIIVGPFLLHLKSPAFLEIWQTFWKQTLTKFFSRYINGLTYFHVKKKQNFFPSPMVALFWNTRNNMFSFRQRNPIDSEGFYPCCYMS